MEVATGSLAIRPNSTMGYEVTTDRVFLRLGPNGTLGADEHQWILYRAGNAVSFVHSTALDLAERKMRKTTRPGADFTGAGTPEVIEITPAMVKAGELVVCGMDLSTAPESYWAEEVIRAALAARAEA